MVSRDIATVTGSKSGSNCIVAYHDVPDCELGSTHLHVLWYHHKRSAITECLQLWLGYHGYNIKCSEVYNESGLAKYLRSGGGRHVLYEKDVDRSAPRMHNTRREAEPTSFGQGPENWEENNGHDNPGTSKRSASEANLDQEEPSVAGQLEGGPTRNKKERTPRVVTIRRMVGKFKPETSLELIQAVQIMGTSFEKEFLITANTTNTFQYQLDQAIYEDHLANKFTPWMTLMESCNTSVLEMRKNLLTVDESFDWIVRILDFNGINPYDFVTDLVEIIDRRKPKKNTLWLKGAPNCGKSLLINSIGDSLLYAFRGDQPDPKEARFTYAGLATARIGILNEFKIYSNVADKMLLLLEGAEVLNDVKNKQAVNIQRTPLLISTNGDLWDGLPMREQETKKGAILQRVTKYHMSTFEELADCNGALNPLAWRKMIEKYYLTTVPCEFDFNLLIQ